MRWSPSLALLLPALLLPAAAAFPQEGTLLPSRPVVLPLPSGDLSSAEQRELDAWVRDMRKWQQQEKLAPNEPAHDPFGRLVKRTPQPEPPAWLDARCAPYDRAALSALGPPLGPGCRLLAGIAEDPAASAMAASTAAARAAAEKVRKNTFLTRIHLDGAWTSTSTDYRVYGLVGSHISLVDVGRLQFFGPPGIILLSMPDGRGSHEIRPGYTWGISVRLADLRLVSPTKNMTLFLTVAKVWVTGGNAYDRLSPGGYDIAGFSIAPRKHK
jgi:hypothetical protein